MENSVTTIESSKHTESEACKIEQEEEEKEKKVEIVWRETLEDGEIAVSNYSHEVRERETADLKDWKVDFDKVTQSNINLYIDYPTSQYPQKFHVYHQTLSMYMQVKKYDEVKHVYLLKPKLKED